MVNVAVIDIVMVYTVIVCTHMTCKDMAYIVLYVFCL